MLRADEHHQFRAMVRDYVEREINPRIPNWEEAEMMPLHDIFASMGKLGLLGLGYDAAVGGQGAVTGCRVKLHETDRSHDV